MYSGFTPCTRIPTSASASTSRPNLLHFTHIFWSNALNFHSNQLICRQLQARGAHLLDVLGSDALYPQSDQFFSVEAKAQSVHLPYIVGSYALNLQRDGLIDREVLQARSPHLFNEALLAA